MATQCRGVYNWPHIQCLLSITSFQTSCLIFIQKCKQILNSPSAEVCTVCCISEHAHCTLHTAPHKKCGVKHVSQTLRKKHVLVNIRRIIWIMRKASWKTAPKRRVFIQTKVPVHCLWARRCYAAINCNMISAVDRCFLFSCLCKRKF